MKCLVRLTTIVFLTVSTNLLGQNWQELGYEKLKTKGYGEAVLYFSKAIDQSPNGFCFWNRGLAKFHLGKHHEAIKDYKVALKYYQNNKETKSALHKNIALTYEVLEDYKLVIEYYSLSLKENPDGSSYWNRGRVYSKTQKYQEAIEDFTAAIKYYQNDNESLSILYNNIGLINTTLNEYDKSIQFFNKSLDQKPNGIAFWYR
ncbi:MAG: tetratricopeptide repeat protein [Salinivirgaceae bacterium]|jgi:tetratricopeptide (TPR) repeat protein|nr:tetratricopeptide repeat protein [Salinivirgaceae bacterium]